MGNLTDFLTDKQEYAFTQWLKHDPLIFINEGAVRSGKTVIDNIIFRYLVESQKNKRRDFIITGYTIGSIERNVIRPMCEMFNMKIKPDQFNRFDWFGNKVHCFGTDNENSYKSEQGLTAYGWYANEMILHHPNSIKESFDRTSGDGFRIIGDTNPSYPDHSIKTDLIDKSGERLDSGQLRILSLHWELEDNTKLSRAYVENLKKTTPPGMWYDRAIKGLWVAAEGVVYEGFNRETHVIEPFEIPAHWKRYRAIDFGYTNPFVCLWGAVDEDGRLFIYEEHKQAQMLIGDHVRKIRNRDEYYTDEWGGEHEIGYETVSDHDAQDNAELRALGLYTRNANKDVTIGIQKVAERMVKQPDGRHRLYIFGNCKETIREIGKYAWAEKKEGKPIKEEPVKVDDHCMDALRYMVMDIDKPGISVPDYSAGDIGL